jgi:lipopolysaccharide export system permease protein
MKARRSIVTQFDFYLLRRMAPRMGAALLVTLLALLLEKVLRLIDLVSIEGAPFELVIGMALNLVPRYLGLALPATFCIAVLTSLATLSRENELDALESAGWSLRRIGAPYIAASVVLAMVSLPLFGFLQPYTRYGYKTIKHAVMNAGWTGRLEQGVFVDAGNGLVISAGEVDPTGRILSRVFVSQRQEGQESVFTSRIGLIVPDKKDRVIRLLLKDGRGLVGNGWLQFDDLKLSRGFEIDRNPFRPRGGSERELTLSELRVRATGADGLPPEPRYAAEFHGRLVRTVALIGVALMSIPLGVMRKRAAVWPRVALALVTLITFHHILQTVQSLASLGRVNAVVGLWGVGGVFILGSGWLYAVTPGQGAPSPLRGLLRGLDAIASDLGALMRRVGSRLGIQS